VSLSYREDYWHSTDAKEAFMRYLLEVFGLDLHLWDKMGFWDNKYRPFSFFDNDIVVSNVCVYSMEMVVQGNFSRVAQISAVGTLPEYRRQGLSKELIEKATKWAGSRHDFFYLFADRGAYPLYAKLGFTLVDEYKSRIQLAGETARPGSVKLDVARKGQLDLVYRYALDRAPVSETLGVLNDKLFMYWCLYGLRDYIYHIPDLDILVLYKRENSLVTVYDIIGSEIPLFSDIYPYLADERDAAAEFLFMPDRLNLNSVEAVKIEDHGTHIMGNFPLVNTQFIYPITSHA
jgi:GNAT superfamily N-acetyltransferase